jgi:hypothetical protein
MSKEFYAIGLGRKQHRISDSPFGDTRERCFLFLPPRWEEEEEGLQGVPPRWGAGPMALMLWLDWVI